MTRRPLVGVVLAATAVAASFTMGRALAESTGSDPLVVVKRGETVTVPVHTPTDPVVVTVPVETVTTVTVPGPVVERQVVKWRDREVVKWRERSLDDMLLSAFPVQCSPVRRTWSEAAASRDAGGYECWRYRPAFYLAPDDKGSQTGLVVDCDHEYVWCDDEGS